MEPNPVLEIYRGQKVYLYNTICIRVNRSEKKAFIDAKKDQKLSARKAVSTLGLLCGQKIEDAPIKKYRGVPIKKYNKILIRVSFDEMKKFIDVRLDYGFSAKKAISKLGLLCPSCSNEPIIVKKNAHGNNKVN